MATNRLASVLVIGILVLSSLALVTSACGTQPPAKPVMEILSPPSGSEVATGEEIQVQYRATDPVAVVRVELEVDGQIVDSQNSPVAEGQPSLIGILRWTPDTPGTQSLIAYAYNRDRVASAPVGINIIVVEKAALGPTATPTGTASPTATGTPAPTPTQTSVPAPSYGPITFATGRTADFKPINPGTVFPEGTEKIYASVSFQGMTNGLAWQSKLYRDGNQIGFEPGTWQSGTSGTWWHWWSDTSPGNYRYEIWIDGQLMQSGTFVIREAGPHFGPITFAQGNTEDNQPINPTATFPPGTTELYAFWDYSGMNDGMEWGRKWYHETEERVSKTATWDGDASGTYSLRYHTTTGEPLDSGNWKLELYIHGQLVQSSTFVIQ